MYQWTLASCVFIHSATLCLLMRALKVIIDRYVVLEFNSKEQWPPSGKKEDKDIRTHRGLPGLNLAQVCILFFSPSSRQLNLSANRKTKENVFSEAHGNWAPQATETLKCCHSVLSGVLYQLQIMRKHRCVFQRSHECFHLPALSWGYRTGTPQQMFYSWVWREILGYQSVFFLPSVFSGISLCPGTSLPSFHCSSFPTR